MSLRPYQVEAIEGLRRKFREGRRRLLLVSPTGSGKTVTFCQVVQSAVAKGSRALIVAHRRELVAQASQKLTRYGVPHGIIQAGFRPAPQHAVQVASIQTLMSRPDAASRVDMVVVDECHHITTANGYAKVLARYPQALVLGVTATPWRLDGQGLSDVFDAHVVATTPRQLRDEGFLVPVGGWEYEAIDTEKARVQQGDFVAKDLEESATSRRVVGDIVSEWLLHAAGKRTVLFTVTVAQSQLMVQAFREAGVSAEHVDGTMPTAERDAILRRLRSGETLVVSNCNVLTEGFDCPELEVCVLARPTLSTSLFLQMVGRVLRPVCFDCHEPSSALEASCSSCGSTNVKRLARLHDHAGCLAAHGHPFAERDWSPEVASRGARKSKGGAARALRCSACNSATSRWPCDACGFAPDPKELQIEYEPAAARKEITADGAVPKKRKDTDEERAQRWAERYRFDGEYFGRRAFFFKMAEKHGPRRAKHVYHWASGNTERPRADWVAQAEAEAAQRAGASP